MKTLRILLADDNAAIHPLIRKILGPEFTIVESVFDGQALVIATLTHAPEVLIVDISMPVMNGIEAIRQLASARPSAVVMLTTHADASLAQQALGAGALGYVLKGKAATDLVPAIHAALRGERFISSSINLAS